jgi:hypothetical protein
VEHPLAIAPMCYAARLGGGTRPIRNRQTFPDKHPADITISRREVRQPCTRAGSVQEQGRRRWSAPVFARWNSLLPRGLSRMSVQEP